MSVAEVSTHPAKARSISRAGLSWGSGTPVVRGLVGVAVLLGAWQLAASIGFVNTYLLPSPAMVGESFAEALRSGELIRDTVSSLKRVGVGFLLASIVGTALGVMLAWWRTAGEFVRPVIEAIRPIPPIAWTPLAILWFGIGDAPGYFLVFMGAVFPVFINTFVAVRNLDRNLINAALCLGSSQRLLITNVIIPGALPVIFPGLRIALGVGWMCVVAAELIAAESGLGYAIQNDRQMMNTSGIFVGMAVIGGLGFLMNWLMGELERRVMPWK